MVSDDVSTKVSKIMDYANSLACLMIGDDLGRLGDVSKNYSSVISHSVQWLSWFKDSISSEFNPVKHSVKKLCSLHPDNSIIIQMYGHSGFGKSTTVKNIISKLNDVGIEWEYAERDKSYYNVYVRTNKIDVSDVIRDVNYKDVYEYI